MSPAPTARRGALRLLLAMTLPLGLGLAACEAQDGQPRATVAAPLDVAPVAQAQRDGDWLGGPELVSGKLRSGVTSWWRLVPARLLAGVPFELLLRLEDVQADGATLSVTTSDGARLAGNAAMQRWALTAGRPAQVSVRLVAPPGDSYLHITTQQRGRSSVRSVLLALPVVAGAQAASAAARGDYGSDASGEPIVRMTSGSEGRSAVVSGTDQRR